MNVITVRTEAPGDREAIHHVHATSFPTDAEARLVDALRTSGHLWLSLVAIDSGHVVGHVAFSPVTAEGLDGGVGLAPVAVLPAHRNRGIAAQLIRAGLAECRERGYRFAVVVGNPDYYGRFGFTPANEWGLEDEYNAGQYFQALELQGGAIVRGAGLVKYAPAFAGF